MVARAVRGKMVLGMEVLVVKALRDVDLVDREIVVPMAAAPVASGADPTVFLAAARALVDRTVVLVADLAVPMVLVAVAQNVVPALADLAVPVVLAAEVAGAVRAEAASSSGWIRLTASSTKSFVRLSP